MATVLLVLHLMLALGLIGVVLLQRSEGGGLGMGGGGGGFMTGRGTANLLTRATAALAGLFFLTSIGLTLLAKQTNRVQSPLDLQPLRPLNSRSVPTTPAPGGATPTAPAAATPAAPTATPSPTEKAAPVAPANEGLKAPVPKSQ